MSEKIIKKNQIKEVMHLLLQMYPEASCELDHGSKFELLIAVVLSAQTTDASVNKVTPKLFHKYSDPSSLAAANVSDVEGIIKTIGLYRTKAKNIVNLSRDLCDKFEGKVPDNYDDLITLPGVGRKTANVVLAEAFKIPRIAVDTHVFRVANKIGLVAEKNVVDTEEALMKRLPKSDWILFHHLLIFHGRRCCTARNPKCNKCLIRDICINTMK